VVTLPVRVVAPPALVVKLASGVVPPTVVLKRIVPVLLAVRAWAPLTAPVKVMLPEPALTVSPPLRVVVPLIVTGLLLVVSVLAVAIVTLSP